MSTPTEVSTGAAVVDGVHHVSVEVLGHRVFMGPETARALAETLFVWAKTVEGERRLLAREAKR